MKRRDPRDPLVREHAIIRGDFPARCPACGGTKLSVSKPYAYGDEMVTRVSCTGGEYGPCQFSEKYALKGVS